MAQTLQAVQKASTTARRTLATEKTPQNSQDFAVERASTLWALCITRSDRHARSCGKCAKKRRPHQVAVQVGALTDPAFEAYQLCKVARGLHLEERVAMRAYLDAGGTLPVAGGGVR